MVVPLLAVECVAFKSQESGKYVRATCMSTKGPKKILQVSGEHNKTSYARFHPEPSTEHDAAAGYYHIKSLYNNKYWCVAPMEGKSGCWHILVDANKPEEDLSKPSCTLFRINVLNDHSCEIFHGYTNEGVYIDIPSDGCLLAGKGNPPFQFKLITMPSRFMLPQYVCFKGDNKRYLRVCPLRKLHYFLEYAWKEVHYFIQFSGDDKYRSDTFYRIETNEDGSIRVWNDALGTCWRLDHKTGWWILADNNPDAPSDSLDTIFLPYKFGDDKVALKCLGNNKFCKRLTTDDIWKDCLNACVGTITNEAELRVEEPVRDRKIYNVQYHLEDARVVKEELIYASVVTDVNKTSQPRTQDIPIEYSVMDERKWESSTTWKKSAELSVGVQIPKIGVEGSFHLETGREDSNTWGTSHSEQIKGKHNFPGTVPVNKKVRVNLKIYRATCDVPFSYWQEDLLANGKTVTTKFDDGLFHCVNNYNVVAEATEEDP